MIPTRKNQGETEPEIEGDGRRLVKDLRFIRILRIFEYIRL